MLFFNTIEIINKVITRGKNVNDVEMMWELGTNYNVFVRRLI
jgi:hypothetical protein